MREPFWRFLLLVTVAKGARYSVLALLTVNHLAAA
jgi:membrane protein YqaA with SNARE-associated domain